MPSSSGQDSQEQQNKHNQNKVYSGSVFMLITRLSIKSLGIVSTIFLARLLTPEDFGLVAITVAIYAFIELFGALALGTALIQQKNNTPDDYNSAWTFNVLFGFVAATCLVLIAPVVANFYQDPRLQPVIYVLAFVSILSGLHNIGVIDFRRNLNFRKELQLQLVPKIISFVITLSLAFILRNYWALVFGVLCNQLVVTTYSFIMHPFRPGVCFKSFNKLFKFSRWLLLNNVVHFINDKVSQLIVGKALSPAALGFFSLSKEIGQLPTSHMAVPINIATFPVYSRFQDNPVELKKAYLNTAALTASLTIPSSIGIALVAPLLVSVLLGEQWVSMVPLLQLLALANMFFSITSNNSYIYLAAGKPHISFIINFSRLAVFFALFIPLLDYNGLIGIGQARLGSTLIMVLLVQAAIMRFLKLPLRDLLRAFIRPVAAGLTMALAVWAVQSSVMLSITLLQLLLETLTGVVSYSLVTLLIWHLQGYPEGFEHNIFSRLRLKNFPPKSAGPLP
ncbi:Membrane protein involved in the export of O-antigen and teichoic acid [Arsukibacterium tuosuense]|uniref:Membrane protein involved in the export of O-antigen and teichoic acid n=1 Tax=Arsukibacterium tuosuense TaxID=1323745 RepID=A0A285IUG5_9GAMM|nr:lipopolysaccharide biosynthesis protein [Arsukibacterium tuosuense]SNY51622.1 Membrane protein involved in the export of O-antigen and teichoic acid [Arsukibacterium tuosuense]